jgi:hypothetical protein
MKQLTDEEIKYIFQSFDWFIQNVSIDNWRHYKNLSQNIMEKIGITPEMSEKREYGYLCRTEKDEMWQKFLGKTKKEALDTFGKPNLKSSLDKNGVLIYKYGDVELHFLNDICVMIFDEKRHFTICKL